MKNNWLSFTIPNELRRDLRALSLFIENQTSFNPMSFENIHMTAMFFGKVPVREQEVIDIVSRHNLSGSFEFDKLEFFPPSKRNLIIARFKMSSPEISNTLNEIKKELSDELGYVFAEKDLKSDFVPHITLGKLKVSSNELHDLINSTFLTDLEHDAVGERHDLRFDIGCGGSAPLYLCGACSRQ